MLGVIVIIHEFIAVFVVQVPEVLEVSVGEVLGDSWQAGGFEVLPDSNWIRWESSWCPSLVPSCYHYILHVECQ